MILEDLTAPCGELAGPDLAQRLHGRPASDRQIEDQNNEIGTAQDFVYASVFEFVIFNDESGGYLSVEGFAVLQ